jgi:hypothetical protein
MHALKYTKVNIKLLLNKKNQISWLENIFFLTCLFPFASPVPICTDVQPFAGIVAFFILIKYRVFTKKEMFYLSVIVISLFYINPYYNFSAIYGGVTIMMFYGITVFLSCRRSLKYFSAKVFNYVVIIYFIFTCLTLIFPDQMLYFQGFVVRNVNVDTLAGPRGVSVFATEPGLLAGLLIAFLLLNDYFFRLGKLSKEKWIWNFVFISLVLLATKSGTGVSYFMIYIVLKTRWSFTRFALILILVLFFLYVIFPFLYNGYAFFSNNRGFDLLYKLLFMPKQLLLDTSIFERFYSIVIGWYSIVAHPFGAGYNGAPYAISGIIRKIPFLANFSNFQDCLGEFGCYTDSSLTNIVAMYGIFGFIFMAFLYVSSKALFRERLFSIIFILASYSLAFPMIWLLLCLQDRVKYLEQPSIGESHKCVE